MKQPTLKRVLKKHRSIIATSKIELSVAIVRKLHCRCCGSPISTSGTLCILEFVQVFKLRKVLGLQSANLLKMNNCTCTFKLFEWLHLYHHNSFPVI